MCFRWYVPNRWKFLGLWDRSSACLVDASRRKWLECDSRSPSECGWGKQAPTTSAHLEPEEAGSRSVNSGVEAGQSLDGPILAFFSLHGEPVTVSLERFRLTKSPRQHFHWQSIRCVLGNPFPGRRARPDLLQGDSCGGRGGPRPSDSGLGPGEAQSPG